MRKALLPLLLFAATTLTAQLTMPPDGANQRASVTQYIGLVKVSIDYITDGAEHDEVLPSAIPGVGPVPAGAAVSSPAPSIYRATWLNGQLLILKYSKLPSENNALMSVSRLALSLDADGSLVVDSLSIPMRPRVNGPKQEPPVSVRSIYKKAR